LKEGDAGKPFSDCTEQELQRATFPPKPKQPRQGGPGDDRQPVPDVDLDEARFLTNAVYDAGTSVSKAGVVAANDYGTVKFNLVNIPKEDLLSVADGFANAVRQWETEHTPKVTRATVRAHRL